MYVCMSGSVTPGQYTHPGDVTCVVEHRRQMGADTASPVTFLGRTHVHHDSAWYWYLTYGHAMRRVWHGNTTSDLLLPLCQDWQGMV